MFIFYLLIECLEEVRRDGAGGYDSIAVRDGVKHLGGATVALVDLEDRGDVAAPVAKDIIE